MDSVFRDGLLKDKAAVITGGGSGIGLAIARRLARAGATVALIGRKQDKLDEAARAIAGDGGRALTRAVDVREAPALGDALGGIAKELGGGYDVLVCAAAGNFAAPALGMSPNAFKSVVDIDLLGTFNVSRAAFEKLKKPGASILNISASQAFQPAMLQVHVCAAKSGVDQVTRVLAMEWGGAGVRVNGIVPGATEGTEGMDRLTPTPESRERLSQMIPLGRYGTKEELAELVLFLCSPAAAYVTGAVIASDGGLTMAAGGMRMMTG